MFRGHGWFLGVVLFGSLWSVHVVRADPPVNGRVDTDATSAAKSSDHAAGDKPAAVETPEYLGSPREALRTFVEGMKEEQYGQAVQAVDFSGLLGPSPDPMEKLHLMRCLQGVIDRLTIVDYGQITDAPEDSQGLGCAFPPGADFQPIRLVRGEDGAWRFSAETIAAIEGVFEAIKDRPILETHRPWHRRELLLGNEVWRVISLFVAILLGLVLGQMSRFLLTRFGAFQEKRQRPVFAVICRTIGKAIAPIFWLAGLDAGVNVLVLDNRVEKFAGSIVHILVVLVVAFAAYRLVDVAIYLLRELARRTGSTLNDMLVPVVSTSLRLTIIVLAFLEIVTALSDKPPSTVIAGLGMGGLAIGLAAQDTIKNFFGSLMIYVDRPFELGDRIVVDGHDGPVEAVGFRSTRIRTLDGHLVSVPNGEMAYKTIHNIGKRPYIRRVMDIRIAYDTSPEKVERALAILREILADHEGMNEEYPPRVFFHDLLEEAMNLRAIYWYYPPAYWDFCDFSEQVNLEILRRFKAEGIRFALPSQTVFLAGDPDRPLPHNGQGIESSR